MHIQFLGAAQTVTGSCFIIEACGTRFAVDCGLYQGNSEIESRNTETKPYRAADLDFILLTHAHIDHSGLLPRIVRDGFKGPIYCTAPTADLVSLMLEDSAHIQETEAEWKCKKINRASGKSDTCKAPQPLYTVNDARAAANLCMPIDYGKTFSPHSCLEVTYYDAGHILGSAMLLLKITEDGKNARLLFSGDLGRPGMLLMHDPAHPKEKIDYLFVETTYGNRDHKNEEATLEELSEAINYSYKNRDKVLIPAFAVGRTQEILYCLYMLYQKGKLPEDMPIYVDSPLAIRASNIFRKYQDLLDTPELAEFTREPAAHLRNIHFTLTPEESQALNAAEGPAIIISASGMCNAGRIRHHLRHNAWRPTVSIVFVGYQGLGTPGRKIVDGAKTIRLFNEDIAVAAKIFTIGGFSAHAGQSQLLDWLSEVLTPQTQVVLIHGEETAQTVFAQKIKERFNITASIPGYLEEMILTPGSENEAATVKVVSEAKPAPRLNWEILLKDTESKMAQIRECMANAQNLTWDEQVELRDRLLELNKDMLSILMAL